MDYQVASACLDERATLTSLRASAGLDERATLSSDGGIMRLTELALCAAVRNQRWAEKRTTQ